MQFQRFQWQCRYFACVFKEIGFRLARKAKNKVGARLQAVFGAHFGGSHRVGPGVVAVDEFQSAVGGAFHSKFNGHRHNLVDARQHIEQFAVDAVGAGAYNESGNAVAHGLAVERFKRFHRRICVCIALEISNVPHVGIFVREKLAPFLQLHSNAVGGVAVGWCERTVIAVNAAARAFVPSRLGHESPTFTDIFCTRPPNLFFINDE